MDLTNNISGHLDKIQTEFQFRHYTLIKQLLKSVSSFFFFITVLMIKKKTKRSGVQSQLSKYFLISIQLLLYYHGAPSHSHTSCPFIMQITSKLFVPPPVLKWFRGAHSRSWWVQALLYSAPKTIIFLYMVESAAASNCGLCYHLSRKLVVITLYNDVSVSRIYRVITLRSCLLR